MIYTKDQLVKIDEDSKILKSRVIAILPGNPGFMIGTDGTAAYLKVIPYNSPNPGIWNINKDPIMFTNSIPNLIEYLDSGISDSTVNIIDVWYTNLLFIKILNRYNFFKDIENNSPCIQYNCIHTNSEFMRIMSIPASQGATRWVIDNSHVIYLYSGLLNVNKSDAVDLKIYDHPDGETFISKFTLDKGKKGKFDVYLHCLKV